MGEYLEQTILSVLGQGYPNLEYIIIDGGSSDNSLEIIKKYESQLAYWISEKDEGMYHAIQKGFEKSTGDIMGWINSDDLLIPGGLSIINDIFSSFPKVEWIQGMPISSNAKGQFIETGNLRKWNRFHFLIGEFMWVQQESTYWKRTLWEKTGSSVNQNLKLAGDFELWLRFFDYAKLYSTKALIGSFRFRGKEQLSVKNYNEYLDEANYSLREKKQSLVVSDKIALMFFYLLFFIFKILRKIGVGSKLFHQFFIDAPYGSPMFIVYDKFKQKFILKNKT